MQVRARLKNFRMSAKKARIVANLVRGMNTKEAKDQLIYLRNKLSDPLVKLIDSSISNAEHNFGLNKSNLYIEEIKINEGTIMKRWRPRAHGRAYPIIKKSCHVELILNEINEGKGRSKVEKKQAKTVSYKELKKIMDEADEMVKKQKGKDKKSKKDPSLEKDKETKASKKIESSKVDDKSKGMVSRIFRRKSF